MNNTTPVIHLKNICYAYPAHPPVLDNLNLSIFEGQRIGLVAPNGSGKTTLFHLIMGLLKPHAGTMEIFGKDIERERDFLAVRQQIGLLFQDSDDQLFSPTVIEDVSFGPLNLGYDRDEALEISRKTLAFLGLSEFEDRITFKLSGGEKRLVSLATVLAMNPKVLLLDEPTTGLDQKTKFRLIDVIKSLSITLLVISHDADFLDATTDMRYTLKDGKIHTDSGEYLHRHVHHHGENLHPHKMT